MSAIQQSDVEIQRPQEFALTRLQGVQYEARPLSRLAPGRAGKITAP